MKEKTVNIAEIAKIAGVHPSTVSRALNNSPLIKEETRAWIQELARKHGYIPDAVAKSLIQGKTFTLGIIVPEISNTFYSHIVDTIDSILSEFGYTLLLCNSRFDKDSELNAIHTLQSKRVDAFVICAPQALEELRILSQNKPVILCDVPEIPVGFDYVAVDEEAGIAAALDHLLARGHRQIGCLADQVTKRRAHILRKLLVARGLSADAAFFFEGDSLGADCGYTGLHAIAAQGKLPTAIFATRDYIAVGAMRAAIELQLDIPAQLALVGYDDLRISSYLYRNLTTIHQPADIIGQTAAQMLLHQLGHREQPVAQIPIIPTLTIRETT